MIRSRKNKWIISFIFSLLVHILFLLFIHLKKTPEKKITYTDDVNLFIDSKQFVIIDDKTDEEFNKDAKFFSKSNTRVENETRAKKWGKPKNVKSSISRDLLNAEKNELISKLAKKSISNEGEESSTWSYLEDINEGEETILNTAEFMYYTFYKRVEEAIVPLWNDEISEYLNNYENIKSSLNAIEYITDVEISLDSDGNFERMNIIKSSGVSGFDRAPGTAFMTASPFLNPPQGLIDQNGSIKMVWRFVVSFHKTYKFGIKYLDPYKY